MRLTPRRRAFLVLLLSWPVALVWVGWIALLVYELIEYANTTGVSCGGALEVVNLPGLIAGCGGNYSVELSALFLAVMVLIAVAAAYGLARWVVNPVRQLADTVERLGPTSLGLRLRADGPHDETRALSDAVDAMLDRVAEGYEAQRRFAANASHELRTPLATQRALIEISLGSALTPEQLALVSRQLLATNERNERLIDGLLTLAETERGLLATGPQPLDRVVRDAVDLLSGAAAQRGITLTVDAARVAVRGEAPLLERLVVNLVQNAIKYNVDGGWVRVTLVPPAVLVVANSGPLVPQEAVAGLFEPFRRLAGERLDHGGGVGLGLTIARSIVTAHHGVVEARANPEGGLAVEVRLPPA